MLVRVDLDLKPQRAHGRHLRLESVDKADHLLDGPPGLAQPGIERAPERVEQRPDRRPGDLHQVDILGISGRRREEQLVQRGPSAERELAGQLWYVEDLDDRAG